MDNIGWDINPGADTRWLLEISIEYPKNPEGYLYVDAELIEIKTQIINELKTSENNKEKLYKILDYFLNDDYEACIEQLTIFGEHIARQFAKKLIKKDFTDFGSAVDALSHYKMTKSGKINYTFIGSMLWSLYYIRNQKLHPYSKIEFNNSLSLTLIKNLSEVLKYLSQNQFQF